MNLYHSHYQAVEWYHVNVMGMIFFISNIACISYLKFIRELLSKILYSKIQLYYILCSAVVICFVQF